MRSKKALVPVAVLAHGLLGAPPISADTLSFKVQFAGCVDKSPAEATELSQIGTNIAADALPDYGEVFFADCEAYFAGGGGVEGGTGTTVNIVAGKSNSVVSRGVLISSSIIQCSYSGPEP